MCYLIFCDIHLDFQINLIWNWSTWLFNLIILWHDFHVLILRLKDRPLHYGYYVWSLILLIIFLKYQIFEDLFNSGFLWEFSVLSLEFCVLSWEFCVLSREFWKLSLGVFLLSWEFSYYLGCSLNILGVLLPILSYLLLTWVISYLS